MRVLLCLLPLAVLMGCSGDGNKAPDDTADLVLDADLGAHEDADADADADSDADADADGGTDSGERPDTCLDAGGDEDEDVDADADADADGGPPAECATLDVESCASDSRCATITARVLTVNEDGSTCVDYSTDVVAVGCMDDDIGCDDAITFAAPPDAPSSPASCMRFSNGCIPAGWEMCDSSMSDEACPPEGDGDTDADGDVPADIECPGSFGGAEGPGCCTTPDDTSADAGRASCVEGEWTCATGSICTCSGTTAEYECVESCESTETSTLPACVFSDHWECVGTTLVSTEECD